MARYAYSGGGLGSTSASAVAAMSQVTGALYVPVVYGLATDGSGRIYATGYCGPLTVLEDPTNAANNISLQRTLSSMQQYHCGMLSAYQTSNCSILWGDRISQTYNSSSEEYAYGKRVAFGSCKLYVGGGIINKIHAGDLNPGTTNNYSGFVGALEPSLQISYSSAVSGCYPAASFPLNLTLSAATQFGGTLNWTGGSVSPTTGSPVTATITGYGTTTYTVTTSGGTCSGMNGTVTAEIYPTASGNTNAGPDVYNCCWGGLPATIGTAAVANLTYSWSPSTGLTSTTVAQPQVTISGSRSYTLTVTDKCGNVSTDVVNVTLNMNCCRIGGTGSADENSENGSFVLFPNPTNGIFTLSFKDADSKVILITDVTGRVVTTMSSTDKNVQIDLSNEANGTYFVQVASQDRVNTTYIIKQ